MGESISDKIAGILSAAPTSSDPEDDVHKETVARVEEKQEDSESDQESRPSGLRKQNVDLLEDLDQRYEGQASSRKKLLDHDDWESEHDQLSDSDNEVAENDFNEDISEDDSSDEVGENDSTEDEDDSSEAEDDSNEDEHANNAEIASASSGEGKKNFKHLSTFDSRGQISKGLCVRQQLNIWENFLEMRIQMQKCLAVANRLPQAKAFNDLKEKCGPEFTSKVSESRTSVMNLLDKLLLLQELLVKKYPETKRVFMEGSKEEKPESDEEIPSDTDGESSGKSDDESGEAPRKKRKLNDYNAEISKRHSKYKDYRNSVIQKWNDKTRIISSKPTNTNHSVVNHIEHILSDKDKLIKRTQLKRTDYEILGDQQEDNTIIENDNQSSEVYNTNIFDDTDFYHHLLRELIEFKSADVTDPVQLGRQWVQLQNLRSKMKRKIDTKATKGRKIRYVVHSKLVNFMAPIDEGQWQDEAKSELFSSLFGKNKSGYSF